MYLTEEEKHEYGFYPSERWIKFGDKYTKRFKEICCRFENDILELIKEGETDCGIDLRSFIKFHNIRINQILKN
jgi:hypothetical protein